MKNQSTDQLINKNDEQHHEAPKHEENKANQHHHQSQANEVNALIVVLTLLFTKSLPFFLLSIVTEQYY